MCSEIVVLTCSKNFIFCFLFVSKDGNVIGVTSETEISVTFSQS